MNSAVAVRHAGQPETAQRRVGLVLGVSTQRQADNDEGSLKNQVQRLSAHIAYKTGACGEDWIEAARYERRAVSGDVWLRTPESQRLQRDITAGLINTVACTALERISRNVKDFLTFFEFLAAHEVEFVCLKQNYDTTTPQGRLFLTMMMALAQFEREQTAERTKDAMATRSERGLWNGGQLFGYDLDPDRKGYLFVNEAEAEAIRFAFDTYLEVGSLASTVEILSEHGYRTKAFTARSGKVHAGKKFRITTLQYLLKNPAYIGLKEVNKRKHVVLHDDEAADYHLVPAVWPPIVEREKFEEVQRLIAANGQTRTNQTRQYAHVYVLSSGLLVCGECGTTMEGRSGKGQLRVRYFYYVCRNRECSLKVAAPEIENGVLDRLRLLAISDGMLDKLVAATNARLNRQLPSLQKRKRALARELANVEGQAKRVVTELLGFEGKGRTLIETRLGELEEQQQGLELSITEVDEALRHIQASALTAEPIREALAQITAIYEQLKPIEKKELFRLLLHRAEVSERKIVLQVRGDALSDGAGFRPGAERFETPIRLPESITQSVVLYEFPVRLRGLRVAKRLREQRLSGVRACTTLPTLAR